VKQLLRIVKRDRGRRDDRKTNPLLRKNSVQAKQDEHIKKKGGEKELSTHRGDEGKRGRRGGPQNKSIHEKKKGLLRP